MYPCIDLLGLYFQIICLRKSLCLSRKLLGESQIFFSYWQKVCKSSTVSAALSTHERDYSQNYFLIKTRLLFSAFISVMWWLTPHFSQCVYTCSKSRADLRSIYHISRGCRSTGSGGQELCQHEVIDFKMLGETQKEARVQVWDLWALFSVIHSSN